MAKCQAVIEREYDPYDGSEIYETCNEEAEYVTTVGRVESELCERHVKELNY